MEPNATPGADVANSRLPALTGLRFFAAAWVVAVARLHRAQAATEAVVSS